MTLEKLIKVTEKLDYVIPPPVNKKELVETVAENVAGKFDGREEEIIEKGWLQPLNGNFPGQNKSMEPKEDLLNYARHYAYDMAPEFSPSFFFFYKLLSKQFLFPNIINSVNISEEPGISEEIKQLSKKSPVVILPNHVSNADHIPICYALGEKEIKQPAIAAGANLYYGSSKKLLPKLNAYKLRRDEMKPRVPWLSNPVYRNTHSEFLNYMLKNNQPMMFYLEGSRSRDGCLQNPKVGILKELMSQARGGQDIFLATLGISYTSVYEDTMLEESRKGKKITDENLLKQLKVMDQDYQNFTNKEINVHLQNIIELTPDSARNFTLRGLSEKIKEDMSSAIKPTPTYNTADAIVTLGKENFSNCELKHAFYNNLKETNYTYNNQVLEDCINSELTTALEVFSTKGFISQDREEYKILNHPLIQQYANRKKNLC